MEEANQEGTGRVRDWKLAARVSEEGHGDPEGHEANPSQKVAGRTSGKEGGCEKPTEAGDCEWTRRARRSGVGSGNSYTDTPTVVPGVGQRHPSFG